MTPTLINSLVAMSGGTVGDDGRARWPGTPETGDWVLDPPAIHPVDDGDRDE